MKYVGNRIFFFLYFVLLKNICFILLSLLTFAVFGQQKILHYTTNNGLPHDVAYGVFQDSRGFIWIGTDNGLVKFDGTDFKIYTSNDGLSSNYIIDIDELSNKNIAIATWRGGLNILNPFTEEISYYLESPKKLSNIEIFSDTIYNYHDYRNNIFWQDSNSTIHHKRRVYKPVANHELEEFSVNHVNLHSIEFKVIEDCLYMFSSRKFREPLKGIYVQQKDKKKLKFPFLSEKVITALTKYNETVFVAGNENKIILFDTNKIIDSIALNIGNTRIIKLNVKENWVYLMSADNKGFMQFFSYNLKTRVLRNLSKVYNIKSTISDFIFDNESNLWISTFGDGLYCIFPKNEGIKNIPLDKNIIDVEFIDDQVILLSNRKVFTLVNNKIQDVHALNGFGKHLINIEDTVIVSSLDFNSTHFFNETISEAYGYRRFKLEKHGLVVISNKIEFRDVSIHCPYNKLQFNIFDAFECGERLYFTTNEGLYFYNATKNILEKHFTGIELLDNSIINAAVKKEDSIFLGTNMGLWSFLDKESFIVNNKYDLVSPQINSLFLDHDNNIWIGTQNGVSIYKNGGFRNITSESGLLSSYVSKIKEDYNKNIWIAGNKGVAILMNNKLPEKTIPPILNIQQKHKQFSYNTISFNRNKIINQYKLNNKNWITVETPKGMLNFSNYKKGKYTLKFRAKTVDSNWTYSKNYTFAISIPWYKETWLLLLISFLIALSIIMLILKRLKQSKLKTRHLQIAIKKRDELENELASVRQNIAQDFHDDLGNKLARISILSNLLEDDSTNLNAEHQELLSQISSDADYLYKGTKDFIFSLKTESDYLEEVITYISDFGEDYLKQFNIVFEVEKNISKNIKLPYYWSKQLIYIFKEAITNVAKHAKCTKACISFNYNDNLLSISCKDDGVGFNLEKISVSNGLKHLQYRAEVIGGQLKINSVSGTTITFIGKPHD
ncbi:hypothetical protein EYD45_00360 [Hyunsoonleella flava]|uniref:Signal transduction histidine kinase subgroup 3 dimerisation and phosphoacceptor domain-containing protein n=1 Tax=Hyunsoonleella flava TaxID=2527939 RepID=A0A4Q9FG18_9FLAO|nr:two-component regulator propeller domain-containing protein [Hyunsoonleella flava]TBN06373.1 hypothetical protein EYD45_00360 [Hyunsoonleella flava]